MVQTSPNKFIHGDCFVRDGLRESWEPMADGIIVMHGYRKYIVMWHEEADRRSGGTKVGQEVEIESFDKRHHATTCPESWTRKRLSTSSIIH